MVKSKAHVGKFKVGDRVAVKNGPYLGEAGIITNVYVDYGAYREYEIEFDSGRRSIYTSIKLVLLESAVHAVTEEQVDHD